MEFQKFVKTVNKFCETVSSCNECPLKELRKESETPYCKDRIFEKPEHAEAIVQTWLDEHPVKTRLSEFEKLFPNFARKEEDRFPATCTDLFDNSDKDRCHRMAGDCEVCKKVFWEKEIE